MRLVLSGFVCLLGITVADVQAGSNSVWVAALQDLNNIGGSISAANSLSATAGRDLTIQTTTQSTNTQVGSANFSRTGVDRVAGLYVSGANGTLVASAGRDLNIVAGVVSNAGSGATSLSAGIPTGIHQCSELRMNAMLATACIRSEESCVNVTDACLKKTDPRFLAKTNDCGARAATRGMERNFCSSGGSKMKFHVKLLMAMISLTGCVRMTCMSPSCLSA